MKGTILIIAAVVFSTFTACKKETTTPSSSTANTDYSGTYSGPDLVFKSVTIVYRKDGTMNNNYPKEESTLVTPGSGYATITKGTNNNFLLTGAGFSSDAMKFSGTNYSIDKKITSVVGSYTKTIEGTGTLLNKELTLNSKTIQTTVSSYGNSSVSYYDSTVVTTMITGSVHLVE